MSERMEDEMNCEHRKIAEIAAVGVPRVHVCRECGAWVAPPEMEAKQLPRCATCRWAKTELVQGVLVCGLVMGVSALGNRGAAIVAEPYGESYSIGMRLHVSPDFGCVMWETGP